MIYLTTESSIQLATEPVDFRRQIDGLVAICQNQLNQNPNSGVLFCFINRAGTMIRILSYDGNGYWLATKRLSKGRFKNWPKSSMPLSSIESAELMRILKSILAHDEKYL